MTAASHPPVAVLRAYRTGALEPMELLAVDDHLSQCADCRRVAAPDAGYALRRVTEAVAGEHLEYEAMERRVDGQATAEENAAIDGHVAVCEECARELADLGRMRAVPRRNARRWAAVAAAMAAAACLAVVVLILPRRTETLPPRPAPPAPVEIAQTPTPPPPAPPRDPLASLDPSLRQVAAALQSGMLVSADLLSSLGSAPEQQRSTDDPRGGEPRLTAPVGVVVETDRPSFRWKAAAPATVQIFDDRFVLVVESARPQQSSWKMPSSLKRGRTYRWQLTVHGENGDLTAPAPPAPPALFHVISARAAADLAVARKSGSPLEIGLLCMREGLVDEGVQMLSRYAEENPDVPIAARLSAGARAAVSARSTAKSR